MTKKLQKSLGIPRLQNLHSSQKPAFLDEWYMNIFNIRKKWYFIFLEAQTFYTLIQPFYLIHGSDEFSTYFPHLLADAMNKELPPRYKAILNVQEIHLRNTENNAPRRIMIDMVYHAQVKKPKNNDLTIFDDLNDIPQALLDFHTPPEIFREEILTMNSIH